MAKIAIPIPAMDFDPTEVAVSWQVLTGLGHRITFATPDGVPGRADTLMLDGVGLDPWGWIPAIRRLRLAGLLLRADRNARRAYRALLQDDAFRRPLRWDALDAARFDALLLPGGHRARGMRPYLESPTLQALTVEAFRMNKPVGAICHGVLLAARSRGEDGRSVLHGRRTTSLTWSLERAAAQSARIGRWWDPHYYRTYREQAGEAPGFMSVEAEVTRALASPTDFRDVPPDAPGRWRKTSGLFRDTPRDRRPSFVVVDGRYVSARWPGDAHSFAQAFHDALRGTGS